MSTDPKPAPATMRELCEKATPGPWIHDWHKRPGCFDCDDTTEWIREETVSRQTGLNTFHTVAMVFSHKANAEFIARCSPETMLAVMTALEAALVRAGQHRQTNYYATGGTVHDPDEDLQKKLFEAIALLNATSERTGGLTNPSGAVTKPE